MNDNKFCTVSKLEVDENDNRKKRTVCKSCYNKEKRKNNNTTSIRNEITASHQQSKVDNVNARNNKKILNIWFSKCGKTYLMSYVLFQKQEIFSYNHKISKLISEYQSSNIR